MKLRTFDRLLARVEQHARPGVLLDVGCATGFLLEAARERGWDPYGVELSEYGSGVAKQRFGETHIVNARLEDATFPDGFFRAVTMTDLIEHVLDPVSTLRVAHRLLDPGGVLCISTPHVGCLSYVLMGRRWTQYKLEHLQYYRPEAMRRLLSTVGFGVVECRAWPKTVTLEYVRTQFARYRHWLISPSVNLLSAMLPRGLRVRPFSVPLGDMLVVAVRHG
jgi:SAM-dependent methyltransferase